jgi:CelD/BcsL family acetyltransferase involved in cellulose biosynthesis
MPATSQPQVRSAVSVPTTERHERIAAIAQEWDELADRLEASPFLRPGWTQAWLDAFPDMSTTVLAVREGGELTAVLPLLRSRALLTSPANSHTPLSGSIAAGAGPAQALARAMIEMRAPRTDLRSLDPGDPLLAQMRTLASELGRATIERVTDREPYVTLSGGLEAYEAGLPRKHRKEIRRMHRRLADEGEVTFEFADGSERLDSLLDEGFAIEGSGWKTDRGSAIAAVPQARRFYTAIARWAAERGWLRLAFLRLEGRPLAFDFCIEAGGSFYALKGGYDIEYRRFGPGSLLTYESLRRAFTAGLGSYEFLGTDDPYKLNWTATTRERVRLQVFSNSPTGRIQHAAWRYGRPAVKAARERLGRQ